MAVTRDVKVRMPLQIEIHRSVGAERNGVITVKLIGNLDSATSPELEGKLAPVLGDTVREVVFDLAALKFISSAGLRVFAATRKTLKQRGGQASFVNLQPQIQEVFSIIQSLPGIAIFRDTAELDQYLAARQRTHQTDQ